MPPIILVLIQGLFLLLLYLFVARAVRAVIRDVRMSAAVPRRAPAHAPAGRAPSRSGAGASTPVAARKVRGHPSELVVHTPSGKPRVIRLDGQEIRFGRSKGCTVPLDDTYVSEQHARVYRSDDGWVIADMGSTNGTYLNKSKLLAPTPLQPGDQVGIGKTVVEVRK